MEIWVHVDKPDYNDTLDSITNLKDRLDTSRKDLKSYQSTLSIPSDNVSINHMKVHEFSDKTEKSASIANKNWSNIKFEVIDENKSNFILQEKDTNCKIEVSKWNDKLIEEHIIENISSGDSIVADVKSNARTNLWYFESVEEY